MADDTRGGRYFREARFFLAGNKAVAQSHVLEARSLMGYMRDMQALGGPPIQVRYATLSDGTTIKATMMNGQYQAGIFSPIRAVETREECASFWSGLFAPWQSVEHQHVVSESLTEPYIGVEWFIPSPYQIIRTPNLMLEYPDDPLKIALPLYFGPDAPELVYPLDAETKTHGDVPETIARIFASQYSGEMRKVIQLLLGQGADLTLTTGLSQPTVPKYAYGYDGTIGLVRVPGDAPAFWMVRFPVHGDSYGILATPFAVCTAGVSGDVPEYVPIEGFVFPEDIGANIGKSVIELMTRAEFDALVGEYEPLYADCGWAFSESGHEAQNVVTQTVELTPTSFEVRAKRIKFNFTPTAQTITCTGEIAETGLLHVPELGSAPRFPDYASGVVQSYQEIAFPIAGSSASGPVHVYYVGDAEQVWRVGTQYFDTETETTTGAVPTNGTPCPGLYSNQTWTPGRMDSWYEMNGDRVGAAWSSGVSNANNLEVYVSGAPPYAPPYILEGIDQRIYKLNQESVWKRVWSEAGRTTTARTTLFVPLYQRQGVQVFTFSIMQQPARTDSHQYYGVSTSGESWLKRVDRDGLWVVTDYFPDWALTPATCGLSQEIKTFFEGGVGVSGTSGAVSLLPGITRPVNWQYTEAVGSVLTTSGQVVYYGAGEETVEGSMSYGRIQNIYLPATGDNPQYTYAYEDAFDPQKHIVSIINPADSADFITNTEYDIAGLPGFRFNFIGLANTGA